MLTRKDLMVLAVSCLLLSLPALMLGLSLTRDAGLYADAGQRVEARILGFETAWQPVHPSLASIGQRAARVSWTGLDGSQEEGLVVLPAHLLASLKPGDSLPLLQVPGLPRRVELDGGALSRAGLANALLAAVLLLAAGLFALRYRQLGRIRRQLFSTGSRVIGQVTGRRRRVGGTILCYSYEAGGRSRRGYSEVLPTSLAARYWDAGPIELLYDPKAPRRSAPDLRRPERRRFAEAAEA